MKEKVLRIECEAAAVLELDDLIPLQGKLKTLSEESYQKIKRSFIEHGYSFPADVWKQKKQHYIIDAHQRVVGLKRMRDEDGWVIPPLPVAWVFAKTKKEAARKLLVAASSYGRVSEEGLAEYVKEFEIDPVDLVNLADFPTVDIGHFNQTYFPDLKEVSFVAGAGGVSDGPVPSLSEKFLVPPFSVFDTRQGYWQDRKRMWNALGLKSDEGRDENLMGAADLPEYASNGSLKIAPGTSIFDPVLAEICYSWFCPDKGEILDPFAGGSVRGIVASCTGRKYIGIDLRKEQVQANKAQIKLATGPKPTWLVGDALDVNKLAPDYQPDMIFTCPPYADLEVYSDDPKDLSNMSYAEFRRAYTEIIVKACAKLKDNRFAAIVVGEVRGKDGSYYGFIPDTIRAFEEAGLKFYNEIVLLNSIGTAALRGDKLINASRKVVKVHQNVLVFVKGSAKIATKVCGKISVMETSAEPDVE